MRMGLFIDILVEEGTLENIVFTRSCLEIYNRKTGNHCALQLEELDERIRRKRKNMDEEFLKQWLASGNFTLNQPQINLGGENTQTNHFYGEEASVRPDGRCPDGMGGEGVSSGDSCREGGEQGAELLAVFSSEEGSRVMAGMVRCHFLNDDFQPQGLSGTEMAVVAAELSKRLNIVNQWKTFGLLWHVNSETLRRAFYKAQDQPKTLGFYDRIKAAMR